MVIIFILSGKAIPLAVTFIPQDRMDSPPQNTGSNSSFGFITIIYVILGLVAIYYLYRFLYTSTTSNTVVLINEQIGANMPPTSLPTIPTPFEGGEYSFNTWVYISSFNKNLNTRKHIFELKGFYFSSLLVGLGAFNNTLIVRTHTQDPSLDGFQSGGSGSGSGSGSGNKYDYEYTPPTTTTPPNAADAMTVGNLSASTVDAMFTPLAMDDSLLTTPTICDLPEIDLQRWTMITVVLNGRTIDVYLDGKLSRSCMASSYYRVDPTSVKPVIAAHGGFDGYIGNTAVGNYAMNPDEIYRAYLSGPSGISQNIFTWFVSLFKGSA